MQADSAIALYLFEESKIDFSVVDDVTVSDTPPWSQSKPQICLSLTFFFFFFYRLQNPKNL